MTLFMENVVLLIFGLFSHCDTFMKTKHPGIKITDMMQAACMHFAVGIMTILHAYHIFIMLAYQNRWCYTYCSACSKELNVVNYIYKRNLKVNLTKSTTLIPGDSQTFWELIKINPNCIFSKMARLAPIFGIFQITSKRDFLKVMFSTLRMAK